ncbi:hypothetical protein FAGKG844_500017 [Frankia sp. AgKG'84/4]
MNTGEIEHGPARDLLREEFLRRRLEGRARGAGRGIERADRSGPLPLSFGQQQMWFLDQLDPGSAEYLVPLAFRLRGPLDPQAMAQAWTGLVARHEILRTRYTFDGTDPRPIIDDPAPVDLPVDDVAADRLDEAVAAEAVTAFDLARDWPIRARLLRVTPDDHVLTLVFHHVAFDAWSAAVVAAELGAGYDAAVDGTSAEAAALPVQYADYAAWQRRTVTGTRLARQLDYWQRQLADLQPVDLTVGRPRPAVRDSRGAHVAFAFPPRLAAGIRDLAARRRTTPFAVLLTAYQLLLARYTGQRDIAVGTVVSGRSRPELQGLVGYCINNLVLRGRLDGNPTFHDLLARTAGALADAHDHQEVPFARLVDDLQPERDMSRSPLYQVAFTMHRRGDAGLALTGLATQPYPATGEVAKCDLELQVDDAPDGSLRGQLVYATSVFERDRATRMAEHLLRLLDAALADGATPVARLEFLDDAERAVAAGGVPRVEPVTACVHELFEAQAARTPDAVAVVADGVSLTYAELNRRANRLAHHLRELGAGPEALVGVCLDPGADLLPTLVGVLKSGAGYLPLDPVNPPDRLGFILADTAVSVVVTDAAHAGLLGEAFDGHRVLLDQAGPALDRAPATNPAPLAGPDNVIYVIYTSGSTGQPKGCVLTHANVVRLMRTADEHCAFTASDVWTMFHSYAFDVSVFEMWGALLHGGRLVLVPRMAARSPEDFLDLLVEHQVTMLSQTPSAFRSLVGLAAAGADDPRLARLALRMVIFAGEPLELPGLRPWVARFGPDRPVLANLYGITETTVHTTFHAVGADDLAPGAGNPIGRPLGDVRLCLLDAAGELVPSGATGEIFVGGPGVARGYLNRPELTAQRFLPDPYGPPGSRLYRSGDTARRHTDATLHFLGRSDDQVKIRGYRIELGEITTTLLTHPAIRQAIVTTRTGTTGEQTLIAYLVPTTPTNQPDPAELRTWLARTLPDYMVPAAFVPLESIPLTPNGKLDRRALPDPDLGSYSHRAPVAPRTPLEERVAAAWGQVLGLDPVGVEDGFFDLGGDSMSAVALVGVLRADGFDLAVRDVFDRRTVAELSGLLAERSAVPAPEQRLVEPFELLGAEDRAALPDGVVDAYPLTQIQTGMVIEMLAEGGDNNYHNCSSFRILDAQPFVPAAFERATQLVVTRHEMLRTSVHLTDYSVPVQLVHAAATVPVGVEDLRTLDEQDRAQALRAHVRRQRQTPFDLAVPTLMRFHAHVDDGAWWLSITECHPIMEGWSYHTLLMELLDAYREIRDGQEPAARERPAVRFADSVAAELAALESAETADYWRGVTERHTPFALPVGWGDGGQDDPDHARTTHHVSVSWADLDGDLRALASTAGTSLKSVLLAAFGKVLSQLTDVPEFHAGLVYDVRPEILGADQVYGMYLNTLPVPFDRAAATWLDLVRQSFAREVESWPHRRFPLPAVRRVSGETGRLIEVFFNYQDFRQVDTTRVDATTGIDDSPTEFPLTVSSRAGHIFLTADSRALSLANTQRIADMFRAVLAAMAADAHGDARTPLIPAAERTLLLDAWAVNPAEPVSHCVYELFELQVARSPGVVAVHAGSASVTYAELDARANRRAQHLRSLGVRPESVVGVLVDRGVELLVSLLGVWKAGAAYLPLDPSFPARRVREMLADAGAPVLLTQSAYRDGIDFTGESIAVDADRAALDAWPALPPPRAADLDQLAYVIYTSGSTGRPKGVQVSQRGLAGHVRWAVDELASRGDGGAPLFSSVAFDLVVPNLWAPLLAGQAVRMVPQDTDLADLGPAVAAGAPYSFVKLTPGHLEVLTHQLTPEQAGGLASILVVAGEALTDRTVADWAALAPGVPLINEYGPTEASVGTCIHPIAGPPSSAVVPIGRPLPNMTMYVLDERLQPVPTGVPGQLFVGGAGVARGYLGRPELTADRFVPDPYGPPGARLYRTGDRARLRPDGNVDFLGRADGQIKIRGYRVELGEIESAIGDQPRVAEARVVLRADSTAGAGMLVAYLVAGPGGAPDLTDLRDRLARTLPAYMVPAAFVLMDALPLNANGKLDHRALPAPSEPALARPGKVLPSTPAQRRLASAWREATSAGEPVGIHDEFFEQGGDSIRAVALVGAARRAGLDLTVRDVFRHRTVAALAELAMSRSALSGEQLVVAPFELIGPQDRERLPEGVVDAYPLSQVQTGMLVEMLADTSRSNYHNVNVYLVRDDAPFDPVAFRRAVETVVDRNDILRTSVSMDGYSVPMQIVHARADVPVGWHDLAGLDADQQRTAMTEFVAAERADLFDLSGPMLRVHAHLRADHEWWASFTQTHAVMDGWSNQLLLVDLLECYQAIRDGRISRPDQVPAVRYADVVAAELASLESAADRDYWRRIVADRAKLVVPAGWHDDLAQPPRTVRTGTSFADIEDDLRTLAVDAQTSFKSVLVAAFVKVMSQLTDEPAFHVGIVTHTRPEAAGADRLYGNFLNTLPFPVDRTARTWRELVRQVADREIEAWPHRHHPMPAIHHPAGERLVDVFFSYLDFHDLDPDRADDSWEFTDAPNEFALRVTSLGGKISLRASSHVLSRHNADRVAAMFRAVLAAMAADADGDARETCLPPGERGWLLETDAPSGANAPAADTAPGSVHELFEAQVSRSPDAIAVVGGAVRLTYAEVNTRADQLAERLRGLGVRTESLVGVCLEPGPALVPALLGVLKAGAGYLSVDPALPADRRRRLLADAGIAVVVAGARQRAALAEATLDDRQGADGDRVPTVILDEAGRPLDDGGAAQADCPGTAASLRSHPDNVFSVPPPVPSSAGRANLRVLTHANAVHLVRAAAARLRLDPSDVWAVCHPATADLSVFEIFGALTHGATLVVVPAAATGSAAALLELLADQQVTILSQTPPEFAALTAAVGADGDADSGRQDGPGARLRLRVVLLSGEHPNRTGLRPWAQAADWPGLPRPTLVTMYATAEPTVHSTFHVVDAGDLAQGAAYRIGRPLAGTRIHLLDGHGRLVPVGVPGEIHLGGPAVARGCLHQPVHTAQRFVPDPFGPPGARLYRTGELARRLPDGEFVLVGHADTLVRIAGQRIEPGEIEAVLATHPRIRSAKVVVRQDTADDATLVAYCVAAGEPPTPEELADHCRRDLPDRLVPAAFVPIDADLLVTDGRLGLGALPTPGQDAFARTTHVAPRSPLQERIAAVWRSVLGLAEIGLHDRYFEVGGDSIKAVRLVGLLRSSGLDVSVRDVFERRTVGGLSDLLAGRDELAPGAERPVEPFALLSAGDRERLTDPAAGTGPVIDAYPMTQVQVGMVVEMLTGTDAYRSFVSYRISDDRLFDPAALRRATRIVLDRHDLLRTSFDLHSFSMPLQIVHADVEPLVQVYDVRGDRDALMRRLSEQRDAPFDLAGAPLLRVAAFLEDDRNWWLSLSRPHAVTEGWSHNWLLAELMECYQRLRDGLGSPPYEPPAVRYADHVAAERRSLASAEDSAYWRAVVDTYAPLALPDDWRDPGPATSYDLPIVLDDLARPLRALADRLQVSVKSVLLAAHVKVMSQLSETRAVHLGLVCDARPELDGADRVYGMHLNTVPFPVPTAARTWRDLVSQVFDQEIELWPHRRYPLPAMQGARGERLLNVVFNFVDLPPADTGSLGAETRFRVSQTDFPLTVHCRADRLNLTTNTGVLGRAAGERLAGMYRAVLTAMAADEFGDARAAYLPAGERERLLAAPPRRQPATLDVAAEVQRWAHAAPGAVAVVDVDGTQVTYGKLNRRANLLAHRLRRLGVGPEVLVALRLERSAELVLTVLAVLKAGGAYLPLDVDSPAERVQFVLADAAASLLVTRRGLAAGGSGDPHLPGGKRLRLRRGGGARHRRGVRARPAGPAGTHRRGEGGRPRPARGSHPGRGPGRLRDDSGDSAHHRTGLVRPPPVGPAHLTARPRPRGRPVRLEPRRRHRALPKGRHLTAPHRAAHRVSLVRGHRPAHIPARHDALPGRPARGLLPVRARRAGPSGRQVRPRPHRAARRATRRPRILRGAEPPWLRLRGCRCPQPRAECFSPTSSTRPGRVSTALSTWTSTAPSTRRCCARPGPSCGPRPTRSASPRSPPATGRDSGTDCGSGWSPPAPRPTCRCSTCPGPPSRAARRRGGCTPTSPTRWTCPAARSRPSR